MVATQTNTVEVFFKHRPRHIHSHKVRLRSGTRVIQVVNRLRDRVAYRVNDRFLSGTDHYSPLLDVAFELIRTAPFLKFVE